MLKYACLVLDHDDTVVRSEATVNYPSFLECLAVICPGKTLSLEDFSRMCFSPGFSEMCRAHFGFTQEQLDWQFAEWKKYVVDHVPPAFAGIDRVIRRQREAGGLVCVSSHSSYINITRDYQKYFGITPDAIFGWDLEPDQRKPAPYALDQIMARFGLAPKDLLMVDDLKPGYDMAKARNVDFAWAGWGRPPIPEIEDFMVAHSDIVCQTPQELERFLFES